MMLGLSSIANFMNRLRAPSFAHILRGRSVQVIQDIKDNTGNMVLDTMWKYSKEMNLVYTCN
jgi:hypothetical protein